MLDYVACNKERNKFFYYFTYFSIILYDFVNCPAFVGIKETLHYKEAMSKYNQGGVYFLCIVTYNCFIFFAGQSLLMVGLNGLFFLWETKNWFLVALDRRLS